MTVGIPGAGIGGLFYLLNAFLMPARELCRLARGQSSQESRRVVVRQFLIALSIVASMWGTAWLISAIASRPVLAPFAGLISVTGSNADLPRLLSYSALTAGLATLALVLLSVQILRVIVAAGISMRSAAPRIMVVTFVLTLPSIGGGQAVDHLQRGDDAFKSGDAGVAEQEFRAVLEQKPEQSHAIFRLAQLMGKKDRKESERLYRKYIGLEPEDAWGYIALADLLGRDAHYDEAVSLYDTAVRLEPEESDAVEGRTRMMELRKTNRRLNAPVIEPSFSVSRDSDGNTRIRNVVGNDFGVGSGARIGLAVGRTLISDTSGSRTLQDFMFTARTRRSSTVQFEGAAGAVRAAKETVPTGRLRLRAGGASNLARMDLRFNRTLLDATPLLVANRIVRSEVTVRPDVAVAPHFRLRGLGGAGLIGGGGEANNRYTVGGGTAWNITPSIELSSNFTAVQYRRSTHAGYSAPARIHAVDIGSYMEFETEKALVALDFGGGAERVREHGALFGKWRPALRGYGLLAFRLRPGKELRFEFDGYNTQAGPVAAPTSGWKYGSLAASFRWTL